MDCQVSNFLKIVNAGLNRKVEELVDPNWERLITHGYQHSIIPLFYEGCKQYASFAEISEHIKHRLFCDCIGVVAEQARHTSEFITVYSKLIQAGLKPLVLKGLICRNTYGELADHRPSGDEDILIEKKEFDHCRRVLISSGFMMEDVMVTDQLLMDKQEISFLNHQTGVYIEVHLNIMGTENKFRRKMNTYFDNALSMSICLQCNGYPIYTLNHTYHYLYLFLHFFKHFTASGVGIRQVIDILMYKKAYRNEIDWALFDSIITDMSAVKLYHDLLIIGEQYLGFDADSVCDSSNIIELLLQDIIEAGAFGKKTKEMVIGRHFTMNKMDGNSFGIIKMMFPTIAMLRDSYPVLCKKPYLIPMIWIIRWGTFVKEKGLLGIRYIIPGIIIGNRRIGLLRKYKVI